MPSRHLIGSVCLAAAALTATVLILASTATGSAGTRNAASFTVRPVGTHLVPMQPFSARSGARRPASHAARAGDRPLTPAQLRSAYSLPATGAKGQKLALISAFNDPSVERDLAAFSYQYRLPSCTVKSGCLEVMGQGGKGSKLPQNDPTHGTWITESSIGTQVVHGLCESCKLILVEANNADKADFSQAVKAAANAGASVIVTSFTTGEDPYFDEQDAPSYPHRHAIVVSAVGDAPAGATYGYFGGANFPSLLSTVIAVGGTKLTLGAHGRYGTETVWPGTISGCSIYESAAPWQAADARAVGCQTRRAVADLAAEAYPGVFIHASDTNFPGGPWYAATGTSVSAPIIGAVIGLAGSLGDREAPTLYARAHRDPAALHDIRSGADAPNCTTPLCEAGPGYDGPSGLGTPYGLAMFLPSGGALSRSHPHIGLEVPRRGLRADRRWRLRLTVSNGNPFAVGGTLSLRATVPSGARRRTITIATGRLTLAPLGSQRLTLTIRSRDRALLRRLRAVGASVTASVRGPVKPTVHASRRTTVRSP